MEMKSRNGSGLEKMSWRYLFSRIKYYRAKLFKRLFILHLKHPPFHAFRKPQFCMHWHFIFQILSNAGRRQSFMQNACILSEFKRFHAPQKWFIFSISRNEGRCIISAPPPLWMLKCVALESHIVSHIFIVSIRDQHSEFDLEKYWDVCFFVAQWLEIFCIIPGMGGI